MVHNIIRRWLPLLLVCMALSACDSTGSDSPASETESLYIAYTTDTVVATLEEKGIQIWLNLSEIPYSGGVVGITVTANNQGRQDIWHTADPEIITEVVSSFRHLRGELITESWVGGSIGLTFECKNGDLYRFSMNGYPDVDMIDSGAWGIESARGGSIHITQGALTRDEWQAIFDRCEKIR